jgi:dihydroorotate dehydrogenase
MVYDGISLPARIARGLDALLARDGFATVANAIGAGRADWL